MRDYLNRDGKIRFLFPVDGDCINVNDGYEKDGMLYVKVIVKADGVKNLEINEKPASFNGENFELEMAFPYGRTTLVAKNSDNGEEQSKIVVLRLKNATGIYRLSSDDNIIFLKDINENKDTYTSIFDNPYLAVYKEAHDKYGANVQLNIHYECKEYANFSTDRGYFNLSMMTDKFKEEWEANSSWLRLSFHAKDVMPRMPYRNTTMTEISEDAKQIHAEIIRFAGEKTLCSNATTVHWGQCTLDGVRGLRNIGIKGLYGYFYNRKATGEPSVSYHYPAYFVDYLRNRDFWYDTEEDMLYGRIDSVLNSLTLDGVIPKMESIKANPGNAGGLDIMIHEQFFYEDFSAYIPEFKEIVLTACKWAQENGYKGYYMEELMNW